MFSYMSTFLRLNIVKRHCKLVLSYLDLIDLVEFIITDIDFKTIVCKFSHWILTDKLKLTKFGPRLHLGDCNLL